VSHTTILRWVIRYVPEFDKRWSRRARKVHSSWRVDETYIRVRGKRLSFAKPWPPACRYLNNIVEQDHRAIKRRCTSMLVFKSFDAFHACRQENGGVHD
jgi:transposase-like protein